MKVAVFSNRRYDEEYLNRANLDAGSPHSLSFYTTPLSGETAVLAQGCGAVCIFVNDVADAECLGRLHEMGVGAVTLRCAGFNNVDLEAARQHGIAVARVPAYSPNAVAEHTIALLLALNRKLHRAWNRVREGNFDLDGLLGFDLCNRTVGIVGTGQIGAIVARILRGFGSRIVAHDLIESAECKDLGVEYLGLNELYAQSDVISLHCPLNVDNQHMIDPAAIARMKPGVVILNTGRGALIDTKAAIEGLKNQHIGGLGLDVYEEESSLFFSDRSNTVLQDDVFSRLLTFPNVLITGHQGFFTDEALTQIASTTVSNLSAIETGADYPRPV
jgi:D-lactate dehydrogenase